MSDDIFVNLNGKLVKITSGSGLTIATHRCARCDATLDEASVEGHGAVCFRPGDYVRWENSMITDMWAEGEITSPPSGPHNTFTMYAVRAGEPAARYIGDISAWGLDARCSLRHIQRPERATGVLFRCQGYRDGKQCETQSGPPAAMGWRCPEHDACATYVGAGAWCMFCGRGPSIHRKATPAPTLYDGLTSMECLGRWYENRARVEFGHQPKHALTAGQIAHAKVEWLTSHGRAASNLLRARIAAARERDRLTVTLDLSEDEL